MKEIQVINEEQFDLHYINKYASLMTQGNGYMGIRASHEEDYAEQTRGLYVAGIYNKFTKNETSELVNLPDIIGMRIELDGEIFSNLAGKLLYYNRTLRLKTGELTREIVWTSKENRRFRLLFQRFVSKDDLHLIASKVSITSLDGDATIKIVTGIDGQQSNFGKQHILEENVRVIDKSVMHGVYRTTEKSQTIAISTGCIQPEECEVAFGAKNRQLLSTIKYDLTCDKPFVLEKVSTIYTSIDHGCEDPAFSSLEATQNYLKVGYDTLLEKSSQMWNVFWENKKIDVITKEEIDQVALDFSLYHMEIMTPAHDERFSVGAKGLTGEGYKGHIFWDTEIFIAPFHLYTEPETAKKLLKYRHLHIQEAKEKALKNGYDGALFPWESAFTGMEETPEFAAINILTGKRQKVASAIAEHHIVADIAFAVVQYYQNTLDDEFMSKEGLALLKETARFWISRATEEKGKLSIKDVIGPDEYTEHIDNNAYTNYMAHFNVEQTLKFMKKFKDLDEDLVNKGELFINKLYLPQPNENGIIPQDDTFLSKPEIDLTKYKQKQGSQAILLDYSRPEVNEMQILKQADVVMLLYLFPHLFSQEIVAKNLHYYEEHTIHDSSLSKAIHAIVASRCEDHETAYRFYQEACLIDLGPNPNSSDEGLHAASLGALWLTTMFGFANISLDYNHLAINPKLPKNWEKLIFPLYWQGARLKIELTHAHVLITKHSGPSIEIEINDEVFTLVDTLEKSY